MNSDTGNLDMPKRICKVLPLSEKIYMHRNTYMYMYIYMCVCIYMYTHTHTCSCAYISGSVLFLGFRLLLGVLKHTPADNGECTVSYIHYLECIVFELGFGILKLFISYYFLS